MRKPGSGQVAAVLLALALAAALVVVVGVFWFGWYETRQNRELMDALPVYPGAEVIEEHPHSIETDENFLTPPDKWVIRRTYSLPESTAGEEEAWFYLNEMPPEWGRCLRHTPTYNAETGEEGVLFQGADFIRERGRSFVSVNVLNPQGGGIRQYGVYLERDLRPRIDPCEPQHLANPGRPGRGGPPESKPTPVPTFPPRMTEEERLAQAVLDCREVMDGDLEVSLMRMFPEAEDLDDAKVRFVRGDWASKEELELMLDRYCPSRVAPPS